MKKRIIKIIFLITGSVFCFAGGDRESGGPDNGGPKSKRTSQQSIMVTDAKGVEVTINLPVKRIVSINSGLSEIIAALGAVDRTVGRDSYSTFPTAMRKIYAVASNSSNPNMEKIFQLQPDLVLADAMFDERHRRMLNRRGIPVLIESTSTPSHLPDLVRTLGFIVEEEKRAQEILNISELYINRVTEKVAAAQTAGAPVPAVFFENRKVYKSASKLSGHHEFIELAGGENIAKDEPVTSPELSPEYIVQRDPNVIVRRVSGDAGTDALKKLLETIYNRPSLKSVTAVQNQNVHIIKSDLFISLRYPVGVAYFAKWFYPGALSDLNIDEIHEGLITELYGADEWKQVHELYVYP